MRQLRAFAAAAAVAAAVIAAHAQAPASAKSWLGHQAEIEDYLRNVPIVKLTDIPVGVTHPRKAQLPPGGPCEFLAWKPIPAALYEGVRESYKSEIAAYEIDKILHLDMVPPTVEKTYRGEKGAAIMWASPTKSFFEFGGQGAPTPPMDKLQAFAFQIAQAKMFDDFIGDPDPNLGNWLVDPAWNVILIDHSRALTSDNTFTQPLRYIDPELWDRMKAVTIESLTPALAKWLDKGDIRAILQRRDKMQKMIDDLVKKYGAADVFLKKP